MTAKKIGTLDYHEELGHLLAFVSDVAIAIRRFSSYNSEVHSDPQGFLRRNPGAPDDLMWLTDAIHNFSSIGRVIAERDHAAVMESCDRFIAEYEHYQSTATPKGAYKSEPRVSFERHKDLVNLGVGKAIFQAIRTKAEQLQAVEETKHAG